MQFVKGQPFFKNSASRAIVLFLALIGVGVMGFAQPLTFTINPKSTAQTIDNFGASGAWFSEGIGKYWKVEQKERMAELLFSKGFDKSGAPLGIGLSAWRFNAGGGTAEQSDSSGIKDAVKRVECFLSPDGIYDWSKQAGYLWFVKKAAEYGVENLILFSNTPPVQFTKNGLGFNLEKNYETNLKEDKYDDYAHFLTTVVQHFDSAGLRFNYISPVNEPQWDWSKPFGQMNQEGSPWHNKDIYRMAVALDSTLQAKRLSAKILLPETAILTALYEGSGHASKQIQAFYNPASPYYVGHLKSLKKVVAGHSYFTDKGDSNIVNIRSSVKDTAGRYSVPFWQSEYSMLADGYKEGKSGKIPAIDCALFLAKIIHHDLVVGNAAAWQLWNAWEPGPAEWDTRYYVLALNGKDSAAGDFAITKNLWALGHYSRFIRPGMKRIVTQRSDGLNDIQAAQNVMLSAFAGANEVVVVMINYTQQAKEVALHLSGKRKIKTIRQYITTADAADDMKPYSLRDYKKMRLKPRSITTVVVQW